MTDVSTWRAAPAGLRVITPGPAARPELLVVLGMHRSGTSAITRALKTMGVELGDRLMPANPEVNARGFWEDLDLNALDIELLQALGADWHTLGSPRDAEIARLNQGSWQLRAVEFLRAKAAQGASFGLKDPRMAKLLPFWQEAISHAGLQAAYVVTVRHPLSVVRSLARRDGLAPEHSYLLWAEHTLRALSGTAGTRRLVVDFDDLLAQPEVQLHRMADALALRLDPVEARAYQAEFLEPALRHTRFSVRDLAIDPHCPVLVRELYEGMRAFLEGGLGESELGTLVDRLGAELERSAVLVAWSGALAGRAAASDARMHPREDVVSSSPVADAAALSLLEELQDALTTQRAQVAMLGSTLLERDRQIATLSDRDRQHEARAQSLVASVEAAQAREAEGLAERAALAQRLERASTDAMAHAAALDTLRRESEEAAQDRERLFQERNELAASHKVFVDAAQSRAAEAAEELQALRQELSEAAQSRDRIARERGELAANIEILRARGDSAEARERELQEELVLRDRMLVARDEQVAAGAQALNERESALHALRGQLDEANARSTQLRNRGDDALAQLEVARIELRRLESENDASRAQMAQTLDALAGAREQVRVLQAENRRVDDRRQTAEASLCAAGSELASLRQSVRDHEFRSAWALRQVDARDHRIAQLEATTSALEASQGSRGAELAVTRGHLDRANAETGRARAKASNLEALLFSQSDALAQQRKTLETARRDAAQIEGRLAASESELTRRNEAIAKLQQQVSHLGEALDAKSVQIEGLLQRLVLKVPVEAQRQPRRAAPWIDLFARMRRR